VTGERDLRRRLGTTALPVSTTGLVEGVRETKTAGELAVMERAAAITGEMAVRLPRMLRPGMTEREAAVMLDCAMRRMGADGPGFETIMLFGPKTALPHGRPGDVRLNPGSLVLADFGAKVDGYQSDCTRVFVCGRPTARQSATYLRVLKAYRRGRRMVRPGVAAGTVDRAARAALGGMARRFIHGLGHGVGLEIHEGPGLFRGGKARLCRGQVVTVEPGVYWPGWGGFRIEDTVLVTASGHRSLTGEPPSRLTSTG
jgi:Xaa-Pro aminopeptidase